MKRRGNGSEKEKFEQIRGGEEEGKGETMFFSFLCLILVRVLWYFLIRIIYFFDFFLQCCVREVWLRIGLSCGGVPSVDGNCVMRFVRVEWCSCENDDFVYLFFWCGEKECEMWIFCARGEEFLKIMMDLKYEFVWKSSNFGRKNGIPVDFITKWLIITYQ